MQGGKIGNTSDDKASSTITQEPEQVPETSSTNRNLILRLRSTSPSNSQKVHWTTDTVDNEHMGKKKSKCCCVYRKPKSFNESSSSDSECETGHCQGHVEKRQKPIEPKKKSP